MNNRKLYESIIKNIGKEIKKALNENIEDSEYTELDYFDEMSNIKKLPINSIASRLRYITGRWATSSHQRAMLIYGNKQILNDLLVAIKEKVDRSANAKIVDCKVLTRNMFEALVKDVQNSDSKLCIFKNFDVCASRCRKYIENICLNNKYQNINLENTQFVCITNKLEDEPSYIDCFDIIEVV